MLASSLMHKNNHKHELGLRNADIGKLLNVELSKSPFALALQRASKQLVVLDRILCSKSVFRGVSATGNNSREEATSGVAFLFSTFVGLSQLLTNCHHQHGSALGQGIWKFHGGLGVLTSCLASVKESTSPVSNPSTSSTFLYTLVRVWWDILNFSCSIFNLLPRLALATRFSMPAFLWPHPKSNIEKLKAEIKSLDLRSASASSLDDQDRTFASGCNWLHVPCSKWPDILVEG